MQKKLCRYLLPFEHNVRTRQTQQRIKRGWRG